MVEQSSKLVGCRCRRCPRGSVGFPNYQASTPPRAHYRGQRFLLCGGPAQPPFEASAMEEWRLPTTPLPKELPDFNKGASTLGPSGADRLTPWRLATVIVQSEKGWGSGAFISSDGWILTTYHVVAVSAQEAAATGRRVSFDIITAGIIDGRPQPQPPLKATLFRADPVHGLALLKLDSFPARGKPFFLLQNRPQDSEWRKLLCHRLSGPEPRRIVVRHGLYEAENVSRVFD